MIDLKYNYWCPIQPSILAENVVTPDLHKDLIETEWGPYTTTLVNKDIGWSYNLRYVYSFKDDQHVLVEIQCHMMNFKYSHNRPNKDKDDIRPVIVDVNWCFVNPVQTINWIECNNERNHSSTVRKVHRSLLV